MRNHLREFYYQNGRKPTEAEAGQLMKLVAMSEPGKAKPESYIARIEKAQANGALGGQKKIPVYLCKNSMKINALLKKKLCHKDISLILDISIKTVGNLTRKKCLPRTKDMILNYEPTKWG